jgi:hypothetical protein
MALLNAADLGHSTRKRAVASAGNFKVLASDRVPRYCIVVYNNNEVSRIGKLGQYQVYHALEILYCKLERFATGGSSAIFFI